MFQGFQSPKRVTTWKAKWFYQDRTGFIRGVWLENGGGTK